jgi:hypothetical protein
MHPAIAAEGAIVEKSYTGVLLRALARGPESEQRLESMLAKRRPGGPCGRRRFGPAPPDRDVFYPTAVPIAIAVILWPVPR